MSIIEVNTDATTLSKIVEYLQSLQVKFTVKGTEESPYDPEFVEMVLKAKEGKSTRINPENIWESIL
jgi:hypothetical protein